MEVGYNVVSIPLIPHDAKARVIFPQEEIRYITYFNPAIEEYIFILEGGEWIDGDFCIEVGESYQIYVDAPITISMVGVRPRFPFTIPIRTRTGEERPDIFGVPGTESVQWNQVFVYNLNISYIAVWDTDIQKWIRYTPTNISSLVFEPGKGYGIRTWEPGAIVFFGHLLTPEFEELRSEYDALKSDYDSLLANYSNLAATYTSLQTDYYNLQANFNALNSTYNSLMSDYDNIQSSYNQLDSTYTALQNSYDELQSSQEALTDELVTIRNLMYVFIVIAITFIATTVYFAVRKPKGKP